MVKTITVKLNRKSENVEGIMKDIIELYEDEIEHFNITDEK